MIRRIYYAMYTTLILYFHILNIGTVLYDHQTIHYIRTKLLFIDKSRHITSSATADLVADRTNIDI